MTEHPRQGQEPSDDGSHNTEPIDTASANTNATVPLERTGGPTPPAAPAQEYAYGSAAPDSAHRADPQPGYYGSHQPYGAQHQAAPHQGAPHQPGSSFGPAYTQPRRKASFGVGTLVASILAAGLVGGGVAAVGIGNGFDDGGSPVSSSSQPETVIVNNTDSVNEITAAAVKATPSVVTISASSGNSGGTGSGIILDDEGHILTNTHVVTLDGATADAHLEIRTSDGRVIAATLVGTDPLSDLAVIKAEDPSGLTPATLGDSGALNVGDTAIAIGSPLGLTGTVTDGIVSTLNRTISVASAAAPEDGDEAENNNGEGFQFAPPGGGTPNAASSSISINVIQTDAAINPGNSGGALVNAKGEVIGVNVAIASAGSDASTTAGNIGVGFSIPINHAKRIAQEIVDNGTASHGQLGVSVKGKTASSRSSEFSVGAEVATVESGSAAENAGIKVGDVITRFNDLTISEPNQLTAAVREQAGGSKVKVTVLRNGKEQTLEVTLGTAPA
ncbi:trypsin-like peptidase domain-containing protein [Pseudarthrobacter sp. J64]|uniref:S1C family serine protease n=1 Tax=Pseudarthrobacter sp. J64 TaxID=3116485 RepID=UPI002E80FEB7|nr:trypsin-like peptidase domain-containing protein [Pseudarthrobacter sp. J64]MEE2568269.1 trypsin-like peptidase domain-containing protein [Pseudarthrobacter sp. J64]